MRIFPTLFVTILLFAQCQSTESGQSEEAKKQLVSNKNLTAGAIIDMIKSEVTCEWREETVDTFKGGKAEQKVSGIATTFLATMDVLKKAKARCINFIITHESTFYNHLDQTEQFEEDAVVAAKKKYIKDNGLVVWRFHDHIHMTEPDGIHEGVVEDLGWKENQISKDLLIFQFEEMTLSDLAGQLKRHYGASSIRVVGNPEMNFTTAGLVVGSPGSMPQIKMLQRDEVEVLVGGETHEWETVEYVRDAISQGRKKALILVGHANSEEAGMRYCADWLKGFISGIPIEFIPAGDPFWTPE